MINDLFDTVHDLPKTTENHQMHESALQRFNSYISKVLLQGAGDGFLPLIQYLMNDLCIVAKGDAAEITYRIVECEVYYYDVKNSHPDPYTHKREGQAKPGSWYFNDFGLDITIGSAGETKDLNIYGGILIRSIRNLKDDTYIHGPSGVLRELFKSFGSIFNSDAGLYLKEVDQPYSDTSIYTTARVNLSKKEEDYFHRAYRYLTGLTPSNKVPGKEALVRQLLSNDSLSEEEISRIEGMLSYKLKK